MTTSHFIIELRNSTRQFDISKLTVHVVSSRSTGITQPNSIILDNARVLFDNLDNIQNFTSRLFHLVKLV